MTTAVHTPQPMGVRGGVQTPGDKATELLAALDVRVPRERVPLTYGIAIGLIAIWLALIPVIYLGILAFLTYLVAWHAWEVVATFEYGPYFVFHIPMTLLGGLLLLFVIKPVFLRRRMRGEGVLTLAEADEPLLFAYLGKLCAATGAPMPSRVEVDCDANAHARAVGGVLSLVRGKLVLRFGLPLAAGLSLRQFTGVLSHELGHFNQRHGMSGSLLIRRLTMFFAQIVFQRDRLDVWLVRNRYARNGLRQGF